MAKPAKDKRYMCPKCGVTKMKNRWPTFVHDCPHCKQSFAIVGYTERKKATVGWNNASDLDWLKSIESNL